MFITLIIINMFKSLWLCWCNIWWKQFFDFSSHHNISPHRINILSQHVLQFFDFCVRFTFFINQCRIKNDFFTSLKKINTEALKGPTFCRLCHCLFSCLSNWQKKVVSSGTTNASFNWQFNVNWHLLVPELTTFFCLFRNWQFISSVPELILCIGFIKDYV